MEYLSFEIQVEFDSGRDYRVSIRSPAGEAVERMQLPDKLELDGRLKDLEIALLRSGGQRRRLPSREENSVQRFGHDLFNALISNEIRTRYDVSQGMAAQEDKGLRVILRIQRPEVAALPWEFLYDPRKAEFLCLSRNTPIVRYPEYAQPVRPLSITPPLKVLGMVASPDDLSPLNIEREKGRIEHAVNRLKGLVKLTWLKAPTWEGLQEEMRGGPWHIFHFIGHGGFNIPSDEGLIVLEDENKHAFELPATSLARLLDHRHLRLVLLNACEGARGGNVDIFSSTASILVRSGIPAVVAMQYEITDTSAIEFSTSFYRAVAQGLPIEAAVVEARKAMSVAVPNSVEWGTPVLYLRSTSSQLFDVDLAHELPAQPTVEEPPPQPAKETKLENQPSTKKAESLVGVATSVTQRGPLLLALLYAIAPSIFRVSLMEYRNIVFAFILSFERNLLDPLMYLWVGGLFVVSSMTSDIRRGRKRWMAALVQTVMHVLLIFLVTWAVQVATVEMPILHGFYFVLLLSALLLASFFGGRKISRLFG